MTGYVDTANSLADRMETLIRSHPKLMKAKSADACFRYKDFNCEDLEPSAFQAEYAFLVAKKRVEGK